MKVLKSSGETENFNFRKVYRGIVRAGGTRALAKSTVADLRSKARDNITTEEILGIILTNLKQEPGVAPRYDLKRAIMSLGPSGFPFEVYFAQILEEYGYETKVSNMIKGKKVTHEVDIVAKKKYKYMVECKYHNSTGKYTGLKEAMYTHARFIDIKNGKFDYSWLATNTHCSGDAIRYSNGVKQKITSWKYPKNNSLKDLIEGKGLYPITIVKCVSSDVKQKLYLAKIMLAKDLKNYSVEELMKNTGISDRILKKILDEVEVILK